MDTNLTKAILRYKGAADEDPTTEDVVGKKLNDAEMHVGLPLFYNAGRASLTPL